MALGEIPESRGSVSEAELQVPGTFRSGGYYADFCGFSPTLLPVQNVFGESLLVCTGESSCNDAVGAILACGLAQLLASPPLDTSAPGIRLPDMEQAAL